MSCIPLINGALWTLNGSLFEKIACSRSSVQELVRDFDDMRNLNFTKLLVFDGVSECLFQPSASSADLIGFIADQALRCDMEIYLAVGSNPQWDMRKELRASLKRGEDFLQEQNRRYGQHPALKGWYIPYEFCLPFEDEGAAFMDFYRGMVDLCKEKSPDKQVLISPFFNPPTEPELMGYGNHSAVEYYEFWSKLLSRCHFDILALQDAGGLHFSCFSIQDTQPYIAAFARACEENHCRFWGNVETGEFHTPSASAFRDVMGDDGNVNSTEACPYWRAVPIERLEKKLNLISKYSECNLSWGYQPFYRLSLGGEAARAYEAYDRYRQKILARMSI